MKGPNITIALLMQIAAGVAVVLAALKYAADERVGSLLVLVFLLVLALPVVLTAGDVQASLKIRRLLNDPYPDVERQREALLAVATSPWTITANPRLRARVLLAALEYREGRFADAAQNYRAILTSGLTLKPGFESNVRLELAHCLDRTGEHIEAERQRELADECLDDQPEDMRGWLSHGKLLDNQHRYAEACQAYEQGLEVVPPAASALRGLLLQHLVVSSHHAGQPSGTVKWAERLLAHGGESAGELIAYRMAGSALGNLWRLEEAERHCQKAYDLAAATRDPEAIGGCVAQLADIQRRRGKLAEADEACMHALTLCAPANRAILLKRAEILRDWGRFEESIEALRQASGAPPMTNPGDERRVQAIITLSRAWEFAELRNVEQSRACLEEAIPAIAGDARVSLWCHATGAWIAGLAGDAPESRRLSERVLPALSEFDQDRNTQVGTLSMLGKAAFGRGDYSQSEQLWRRYIDSSPDPVNRPTALYYLARCRWHEGDRVGAATLLEDACAPGFDTHYARLARAMLAELQKD